MALVTGTPPVRLLDGGAPATWTEWDLEILSQWKRLQGAKCTGCGRPLSQHLYNSRLGREETVDDYTALTMDCPAQQAIAIGQDMWSQEKKAAITAFHKGRGPDPAMGVMWLSQGAHESLPEPDKN